MSKSTTAAPERVHLTDRQVEVACRQLYRSGTTTKVGMLKALRADGRGVRQQRLFPIAERVIAEQAAKAEVRKASRKTPRKAA